MSGAQTTPEQADSKGFWASEQKDTEMGMKGESHYEAAESKIHEKNKLKKDYSVQKNQDLPVSNIHFLLLVSPTGPTVK